MSASTYGAFNSDSISADFELVARGIDRELAKVGEAGQRAEEVAYKDVLWRLSQLQKMFSRLVEINAMLSAREPEAFINPATNELSLRNADGSVTVLMKLKSADPNIPVKIVQSVKKMTFTGGKLPVSAGQSGAVRPLTAELEQLIEQFYSTAFRLLKAIQALPGQRQFPYVGVVLVRNDLIEHPKDARVRQNFGYGDGGPFVRPARSDVAPRDDPGLLANTAELLAECKRRFPGGSSSEVQHLHDKNELH